MIPAPAFLTNPERYMAFSRWAAPMFGLIALAFAAVGLWLGWSAPPDYQQGETVRIMFIHVPASIMAMVIYAFLAGSAFLSLVFRHVLADCAAQGAAVLGAGFTVLALATGSLWGKPMWGTWWVWDARLTSVLVLFLLYVAYLTLRAALDDEAKAARASAILALVGALNLPIIHFSVYWWNSLHQGSSMMTPGALAPVYARPLGLMMLAYLSAFGSLWLVRIRGEVWRRRAEAATLRAARAGS
jgi:heme exporter protein C